MIYLKCRDEIEKMRGRRARRPSGDPDDRRSGIEPGITTGELEDIAMEDHFRKRRDVAVSWLCAGRHPPYPAWTCISVNEEIVHGIPGRRV